MAPLENPASSVNEPADELSPDLADVHIGGWRQERLTPSLPETYHTIAIPRGAGSFWRKLLAFSGPGAMVAVGYMDPGNWATDLAAGSQYNYLLLSVVLISSLMAMFLQPMAARLGIATGRDLAQSCRDHYSRTVNIGLYILCEIAIAACDLAEVLGSAIALNLLFHIPLLWGVCLTALDVFILLLLQHRGFRMLEAFVITMIATIGICFAAELYLSRPDWGGVALGMIPSAKVAFDPAALYIAIGILGATVMPHNLYLHSSIIQTRNYDESEAGKREAIKFATLDSTVSLSFAFFINGAILVLAAATFYRSGHHDVEQIQDAHRLLAPLLGAPLASTLFALALLASGQNSTLTGTLAGQIVMEGFLNLRLNPALRRLITRGIAIIPAVVVIAIYKESGVTPLLIFSQVILSLQLSFATFPLLWFTNDRRKMGVFANGIWTRIFGWTICSIIAVLNGWLLWQTVAGWME